MMINLTPGYNSPYSLNTQTPNYGYGGYYNPYLEKKKQEEQRRLQEEEHSKQNDILEKLMSISLKYNGHSQEEAQKIINTRMRKEGLGDMENLVIQAENEHAKGLYYHNLSTMQKEIDRREYEEKLEIQRKKLEEMNNCGACEYFETIASETLIDLKEAKALSEKRNLSSIYNQSSYQQMIKGNKDVDICDMEISLPEHVRKSHDDEYKARQKAFFDLVFK